jgi:thioredoxin reductase
MREVVIIGAAPAGLAAATYLGRFRRPTQIVDAGAPRARWIPQSHNIPAQSGRRGRRGGCHCGYPHA